jgi:NAD(P)-dependent dehydrogenase (short-subunit alcohol dehydrogenase family)
MAIGTEAVRLCLAGMQARHGSITIILLILAGCSSQQDEELAAVKAAHSVTAEWAAVERLAAQGKLTAVYAGEMRAKAQEELQSERKSLRGAAAQAVDEAQRSPSAASLAAAAQKLDQAEKQLEGQ